MNLDRLGKKLKREAAANPKKAVFLGLATLVAVYFWMPLVLNWIGKRDKSMTTAATKNATQTPAAPTSQPVVKETVPERPPWQQIAQGIRDDQRTMTVPPVTMTRDPFENSAMEAAELQLVEQQKPKPKPPVIAPNAAGLALTSTIIGSQRRIAQINGKTYAVGQTIEVVKEKEATGATYKLIEIQARRVVLEADGQQFELLIPEPNKSEKMELLETAGSR